MITSVGLAGTRTAAAIAGVVSAAMSARRLTAVRASDIRSVPSAGGDPSARGSYSKGW